MIKIPMMVLDREAKSFDGKDGKPIQYIAITAKIDGAIVNLTAKNASKVGVTDGIEMIECQVTADPKTQKAKITIL